MKFEKITEKTSHYDALETRSIKELLMGIHNEDIKKAVEAVGKQLQKIEVMIAEIVLSLKKGEDYYI